MSLLIRDIIDVPVVEAVVRLADSADPGRRAGLAREFVLTRQVERNLGALASSIKEGVGRGHFLVGPYGSGKSHFLSYISLVLAGEAEITGGACPLVRALEGRRFLPVRVSLVNVRGEARLEDAILAEAERAIAAAGGRANLTRRSRFLDHIVRAVRPLDPAGMDAYLKKSNLLPWDTLIKDEHRAATAAWGYTKNLEGCPAMPDAPPDELLRCITAAAGKLGFAGVVIIIDELSEFLRSKPLPAALSDDARYLQLMGEFARSEKFWIVASLQEAIEQTGDIARDVLGKIKDRYPVRLPLDESHIRDLIDGRLIRKKDGARDEIRKVWQKYSDSLPSFTIAFEDFYRLYPLHPATIGYLESLSSLMSAHRGVVDFIVSEIRGDAKRGIEGLMVEPVDRLLTADTIYSHFRDRVKGDDRFTQYDSLVRSDIDRTASKIFRNVPDRLLARRASDVLILNEIAALERPKTVAELAAILLSIISEISPEANEQYLSDVILGPLTKECLFLRGSNEERAGDRVYRVSLERDRRGLLEKEIGAIVAGLSVGDTRPLRAVLEEVQCAVPVREIFKSIRPEVAVSWCGTMRRGVLLWGESVSPAEVGLLLDGPDIDFAVVLALPSLGPTAGELYPAGTIEWVPRFEEDELKLIRRFYAARVVRESLTAERTVKEAAVNVMEEAKPLVARAIESAFRRGKFLRGGKEFVPSADPRAAGFLEKCISHPVIEALKEAHPRFLDVAPQVEFVSRRALVPLIDAIISPGRISMAAARKNNTRTMIEGVLIPMGLARVDGSSYAMQLDPSRSALAREIMDRLSEFPKTAHLMKNLKKGPFGLSSEMAQLAMVSLVKGGLLDLRKNGRRIPAAIVGFDHIGEADEVTPGELLPKSLIDRLFRDGFLSRGFDRKSFSMGGQREAWERLLVAQKEIALHASETIAKLSAISQYPAFDSFDFERIRTAIERGMEALGGVAESQGAARGLEKYLSEERPDLSEILNIAAKSREFADGDAERVVRIADYISNLPPRGCLPEGVAALLLDVEAALNRITDIVLEGSAQYLFSSFDAFIGAYAGWYAGEHRLSFARDRFEPLHAVRQFSSPITDFRRSLAGAAMARAIGTIHRLWLIRWRRSFH